MFSHAEELFEEGDTNHDGKLSSDELQELLMKVWYQYSPNLPLLSLQQNNPENYAQLPALEHPVGHAT